MNILDMIYNNTFLKELFPDGLESTVLIGHINFDLNKKISLSIHTKQKPLKIVKKWGIWGEDYDVIVIEIYGISCYKTILKNWENVDYGILSISKELDVYTLSHSGSSWDIKLQSQMFSFERCDTYIDGRN